MSKRSRRKTFSAVVALIMAIALLIPAASVAAIKKNDNPVNMLMTNPTEDCLTSVNIIWHSPAAQSKLIYTLADDQDFANATEITVDGELGTLDYTGQKAGKYYRYAYTLSGLTEDTAYIYKVTNELGESAVYKFKTAGTKAFRFISLGDTHVNGSDNFTYVAQTKKILDKIESEIGAYDLVVFSGDYVYTGATYNNWVNWNDSKLTSNSIMALTMGNHDSDDRDGVGVKRISDKWFNYSLNNPKNGPEGLESVYWFNYNGVLFLCLDTLADELSEFSSAQKDMGLQSKWMKDVADAQAGKYQYIIVYQHEPLLASDDGSPVNTFASWSYYKFFKKACDDIGADFFIGGDYHEYTRSVRLFNDAEVAADGDKGTYYVTNAMITSSTMASVQKGPGICATYYAGAGTGADVFTATSESLTFQLVNAKGKVIDEIAVPSRRAAVITTAAVEGGPVAQPTEAPKATDAPAVTEAPAPTEAPKATDEPANTTAPAATDAPQATDAPSEGSGNIVIPIVICVSAVVIIGAVAAVILKKK